MSPPCRQRNQGIRWNSIGFLGVPAYALWGARARACACMCTRARAHARAYARTCARARARDPPGGTSQEARRRRQRGRRHQGIHKDLPTPKRAPMNQTALRSSPGSGGTLHPPPLDVPRGTCPLGRAPWDVLPGGTENVMEFHWNPWCSRTPPVYRPRLGDIHVIFFSAQVQYSQEIPCIFGFTSNLQKSI